MSKSCEQITCTLLISHVNMVLIAFCDKGQGTRRDCFVAVSPGPSLFAHLAMVWVKILFILTW